MPAVECLVAVSRSSDHGAQKVWSKFAYVWTLTTENTCFGLSLIHVKSSKKIERLNAILFCAYFFSYK